MFSDAISSISWRWRPSSPRTAAAISGSASASVAVKNESGADAVLAELAGGFIGEISPPPQALEGLADGQSGCRKRHPPNSISGRTGQALAAAARHLCKIWWDAKVFPCP